MRKIAIIFLLLILATTSFSQETKSTQPLTRAELLKKSRTQKTVAFVLLGVGVTTIAILAPGNTDLDALAPLAIGATACIVTSIPLFIAAARNKRKAMNASAFIEMKNIPVMQQKGISYHSYPAVTLKISLR